jgi:hypothetical protein
MTTSLNVDLSLNAMLAQKLGTGALASNLGNFFSFLNNSTSGDSSYESSS